MTPQAILQFSGGKDSLALLYHCRPWLDRIAVYFNDTGGVYPEVLDFVRETCDRVGARLTMIRPDVPVLDYTDAVGLPSDIVPVDCSPELAPHLPGPRLQSTYQCCGAMLWAPMRKAVLESGAKIVLRGTKASDRHRSAPPGTVDADGIAYHSPLWDWSDADVFDYLRDEGVSLPPWYAEVGAGIDCWCCTAHMKEAGGARLRYLRKRHPDLWPVVETRLGRVREAVINELDIIGREYRAGMED